MKTLEKKAYCIHCILRCEAGETKKEGWGKDCLSYETSVCLRPSVRHEYTGQLMEESPHNNFSSNNYGNCPYYKDERWGAQKIRKGRKVK